MEHRPKTRVFGQSNEWVKKPCKINSGCAVVAQGFWPVAPVAHVPANRCHTSDWDDLTGKRVEGNALVLV
jgi:hypothetical protein